MFDLCELRNGDIVFLSNGEKGVFCSQFLSIMCKNDAYSLNEYYENGEHKTDFDCDIACVFRSCLANDCYYDLDTLLNASKDKNTGIECIYDASENIPIEMTLDEIEIALGHKVKLVNTYEN